MHPKYLLYAAVNRTTINGQPEDGWFPEQETSVEETLRAYTINGAPATFTSDRRGSIEFGKLADLVMLDHNPLETPTEDIQSVEVGLTMVDGEIVFER